MSRKDATAHRLALIHLIDAARQGETVAELAARAARALGWSDTDVFSLAEELTDRGTR